MPLSSWLLGSLMLCAAIVVHGEKCYDDWSIIKVYPKNDGQVQSVNELLNVLVDNVTLHDQLQVWKHGTAQLPFNIFLSPAAKPVLMDNLDQFGIAYNVTLKNAQRALNAEKIPQSTKTRTLLKLANNGWFSKFLKLEEINSALQTLSNLYPNLMKLESIGTGWEGNSINMAKVSSNLANSSKPAILLDGGIHAREWIAPATVLYVLNKLVTEYSTNTAIQNMVDSATWYIIPVLNPDGYAYTAKDRMWRKNRRAGKKNSCYGVDLNRNFDFDFGGTGTSTNPCDDTYRGPGPFSEPESRALRDFIGNHTDIKAYLTLHSYSQMWFYPYGHKKSSYTSNRNDLAAIAKNGAQALKNVYGKNFSVGTAADILYPSSGGSDDWAKGKANIPYVFCLELRPDEDSGDGFILPTNQIVPTAEETWAGLNVVANAVIGSTTTGTTTTAATGIKPTEKPSFSSLGEWLWTWWSG